MGYHVGNTHGQPQRLRQAILSEIYEGDLPPVSSNEYLRQWGPPRTRQRFNKLVGTLIGLAKRESQSNGRNLVRAVCERVQDIIFLTQKYRHPVYFDVEAIFQRLAA